MNSDLATAMASLEADIHRLIPIAREMGIRVSAYAVNQLTLRAPLANNINHQMSAFGGSLFSVAALSGWGLLQLKTGELRLKCNTVIADGEVSFKRPVFDDFVCTCALPDTYPDFVQALRETGKSSLILTPQILIADQVAMTFSGRYVVSVMK